ncbi:L,D-transpeptidase [Chamaesiphon sp. OTE_20_metabat_361]|uniref:L,D-transpeptidase n=1 Tax=Chamaesiphon sp. OTE_20_metabat_361 TaxID=2964689 RepID=UPI00286AC7EB|nr:L,D-transpeptidase [Chamaesiphon sp. OTE_20_metabat_361]
MNSKLILTTLICSIALTSCSNSQAQTAIADLTQTANIEKTSAIAISQPKESATTSTEISKSSIDSASGGRCTEINNHLFIGNRIAKNKYNNPIYPMYLCVGGKEVRSYQIVTGRNFTQQRNRNQSGTQSPLPNGKYRIGTALTPGLLVEVGKVEGLGVRQPFLPISPLFNTGRSALGFHVDPSYNKDPKEDGTSGCIGLTTSADFKSLWADIKNYQVRDLQVAINTKAADNPDVAERQ